MVEGKLDKSAELVVKVIEGVRGSGTEAAGHAAQERKMSCTVGVGSDVRRQAQQLAARRILRALHPILQPTRSQSLVPLRKSEGGR